MCRVARFGQDGLIAGIGASVGGAHVVRVRSGYGQGKISSNLLKVKVVRVVREEKIIYIETIYNSLLYMMCVFPIYDLKGTLTTDLFDIQWVSVHATLTTLTISTSWVTYRVINARCPRNDPDHFRIIGCVSIRLLCHIARERRVERGRDRRRCSRVADRPSGQRLH